MAKRRMGIIALLLCCVCLLPFGALAVSTVDAVEPILPQKECALTIGYRIEGQGIADVPVRLYRVAEVSADFQYTLAEPFAPCGLVLNGVQTVGEWNVIRSTLEAYIVANGVEEGWSAVSDMSGEISFEGLEPGLYLAVPENTVADRMTYVFESALIVLPGLGEGGLWEYERAVTAKGEALPPVGGDEEKEFRVIKLWKGDEGLVVRPQSIEVEIFRNGVSWQQVTLSKKNHWSYAWTAKDDAAWTVTEKNVPQGYVMTVSRRSATFVLTNTFGSELPPSDPPKTGDTPHIMLYTGLMYASGMVLIVLGLTGKRKRHDEK